MNCTSYYSVIQALFKSGGIIYSDRVLNNPYNIMLLTFWTVSLNTDLCGVLPFKTL